MNTQECIEFLEEGTDFTAPEFRYSDYRDKINEVIKRLQMWEEFKSSYGDDYYTKESEKWWDRLSTIMDEFENKRFPKKINKKIEIEFEADNKEQIKKSINLLKAELDRNNICPKIKINVKKCD